LGRLGHVFTKENGEQLIADSVSQRFDRLVTRHKMPPVRLHDLRHGAATLALAAGVDIKVVSEEFGHSNSQITRDLYTSVLPELATAAAEAVAALVPRDRQWMATHRPGARPDQSTDVPTPCPPADNADSDGGDPEDETAGHHPWGGSDSNRRPKDYESSALTN
jgi:hypothetical protein